MELTSVEVVLALSEHEIIQRDRFAGWLIQICLSEKNRPRYYAHSEQAGTFLAPIKLPIGGRVHIASVCFTSQCQK